MVGKKKTSKKGGEKENELKAQLVRALADYDNLRKRVEKEKEELWKLMSARFVLRVLPIYDMLQSAQGHLKDPGVAITLDEFEKVLNEEGVEKIEIKAGDKFNEEYCEATSTTATKDKKMKGKVAQVILDGFKIKGGQVIRPAKVEVYN